MRSFFFIAMMLATSLVTMAQETMEPVTIIIDDPLTAFLADEGQGTNILNKASGATVMTLSSEYDYLFTLTTPQEGWWKRDMRSAIIL